MLDKVNSVVDNLVINTLNPGQARYKHVLHHAVKAVTAHRLAFVIRYLAENVG